MNTNQPKFKLEIGDEIGFVSLAQNVDSNDRVSYFPVVEITERDGERAYRYQYPDGQISRTAIKESMLEYYTIRIHRSETIAPKNEDAICLTNRRLEFQSAYKRAKDSNIEVFRGWDNDTFHVVNWTNQTEYLVELNTVENKIYAQCDCKDFIYRKRVCKHISEVLQEVFFGEKVAV